MDANIFRIISWIFAVAFVSGFGYAAYVGQEQSRDIISMLDYILIAFIVMRAGFWAFEKDVWQGDKVVKLEKLSITFLFLAMVGCVGVFVTKFVSPLSMYLSWAVSLSSISMVLFMLTILFLDGYYAKLTNEKRNAGNVFSN